MHLPTAPPAASPWDPPPGTPSRGSWAGAPQQTAVSVEGGIVEGVAQHCSSWHGQGDSKCRDPSVPNLKQKRQVRLLSQLLGVPTPDVDSMTWREAEAYVRNHWQQWMTR
uniref:Uncharacterized protein n=1 Tax=Haptolina ericina TaxID=156174 RepID=A0A7S3C4N0_9EUKA|mmetsp:Transcript_9025/g.20183  ORF Transcript_9025/g.20183 Transcript_9025/m.20183 type:complete len:110 (+) Transcript_9025:191-520(+)